MFRSTWSRVAASSVALGVPSYYYYRSTRQEKLETFDLNIRVRGPGGKAEMSQRSFTLLPLSTLETRIREHAVAETRSRPGGLIWNHTTASLASNDPIEDANSNAIIARDLTDPSAPGDLLFFAVMDGHGGRDTSQLLSKVLINAVVLELNSLTTDASSSTTKPGVLDSIKSKIWSSSPTAALIAGNPDDTAKAIENAFTKLDQELVNAPLRVLANNLDEEARKNKIIPDLSKHPLALTTMLPALSGSCALMAVIDTAHRDLYIACTGDCRAVAGIWEESADGQGSWRVEVLSEDQTGRNPNELKRMQSEHPPDEASYVIQNGRVLGGLEPSRAFGDARYKWPRVIQETLNDAFMAGNDRSMRQPPTLLKTPPYVTARPVVTHRKLEFLPLSEDKASKSTLRFLVLATDGLWDQLSSEQVVSLVGGHLAGLKGVVPKTQLATLVPTSSGAPTIEGKDKTRRKEEGSWEFVEENLSAHLIRNAFGGGDHNQLRQLLSIPAPLSRRYRDDVTVTVLWWEDGREGSAKVASHTPLKAKL